jgi:hypothetical protein
MEAVPQIGRPDPETSEARSPQDAPRDLHALSEAEPAEQSAAPAEASAGAALDPSGSIASDVSGEPEESSELAESVETTEALGAEAATATSGPALPVPVGEPQKRRSLWRRLTGRGEPRSSEPNGFQDMVKSRLDGITLRLESFEHGIARNEARLESRFALLERIERRLDDLSDLAERADQARAAAREAAEASRGAAQTARVAAGVAVVAVVISVAALLVGLELIG